MKIKPNPLMKPAEVARRFHVTTKTVDRWAKAGKLNFTHTMGGQRRFFRDEVERELKERGNA